MKKTLLLAAALACSGAVAQEKEIWACQQETGTMLEWENGSWREYFRKPEPILLTLNGEDSSFKMRSSETELNCSQIFGEISCVSKFAATAHILLDQTSGNMGISFLWGAIQNANVRDSVVAAIYNCTKF